MAASNALRVTYAAASSGAQTPLSIDWRDDVPSGYSYEVQFNAGASGSVTIESTLDDINDSSITPDWIAETGAITADTRGVIGHPVAAVRLNISSLTGGSATFKLLGGSVIGDTSGVVPSGGGGASSNINLAQVGGTSVVTAGVSGLLAVGGNVDHGVTDTGNPVKIGGRALAAFPSAVTTGQRVNAYFNPVGAIAITGGGTMGDGVSSAAGWSDITGSPNRVVASGMYAYDGSVLNRVRANTVANGGALLTELGPYSFGRVTADGQIKGSAGFIHTITIAPTGSVTAGVLTIYNNTAESGTVIFSVSLPVTTFTPFTVTLDAACSTGIYVGFDATLANVGVTVSYR